MRKKSVSSFSLGMKRRLDIATALLGDTDVLIFDEPANGLDPLGIEYMGPYRSIESGAGQNHAYL